MAFVRQLDERMLTLQRQGRIGFYAACTGQEAAVIGSAYALRDQDWIFPAFREAAAMLLRGFPLRTFLCQLFGNSQDVLKGRQMPCHYSDRSVRYVSWSSCVGNQLPQAVGAAWAAKIRGDDAVVMAYLGDGATSEGDFHVAMNFAGVFQAPVVFFCQNNQWAISVPVTQQTASATLAVKARAYSFEGVRIDGNDVLEVYSASRQALAKARSGSGPSLIEALTYRMGAHSSSDDPSRYRDESITEAWKKKDPILRFRRYLEKEGLWDPDWEEGLQRESQEQISDALRYAEQQSPPPHAVLFEDVFSDLPWHLREQLEQMLEPETLKPKT